MKRKLILIVDNQPQTVKHIKSCLNDLGFQVGIASSGEDVLRYLDIDRPKLILLGLLNPDQNGYAILKEIRRREAHSNDDRIPIIMQGDRGLPTQILCETEGIAGFLREPYADEDLKDAVTFVLGGDFGGQKNIGCG